LGKFHEYELPGEDLIIKGLEDLNNNIESIESLLVLIGAPRLRALNLPIPKSLHREFPENRLYRLLERQDSNNTYSRFNAYIRLLVSFESSLENLRKKGRNSDL